MPGQALAIHDVAPVIHPHCVKHAFCDIDPEDVYLVLHGTCLLWLNRFTDRELIVAHCRRSAQGRGHFITTAFTMAAFNVLVKWHGFQPSASGFVPLSIAEFSL